jgi:hypothetical protein
MIKVTKICLIKSKEAPMIKVTKICLIKSKEAPDELLLHTTLPNGMYPFNGNATITLQVAKGMGEKYCDENFERVELEIVVRIIPRNH